MPYKIILECLVCKKDANPRLFNTDDELAVGVIEVLGNMRCRGKEGSGCGGRFKLVSVEEVPAEVPES